MNKDKRKTTITLPGFVDVHVHFREPGFSYKGTVLSEGLAAIAGGYSAVCTMPNLKPVPDSVENLMPQLELIEKAERKILTQTKRRLRVFPYGALTVDEAGEKLADLEALSPYVIAFSDDGRGVQSKELMREAMRRAAALGKLIAAHCEDNSLLRGGYIHDGSYARAHGHRGLCSESEGGPIARDLELAAATGCAYHVCHVSAKESVELIRQAKRSGVNVTCETAPHYLLLSDGDLREDGAFKMNPPLRSPDDRDALREGLRDGTIDIIATDHAPHSAEEKSRGLEGSAFGIVGLEAAFPLLYTYLVKKHVITLKKLVELMAYNPAARFGIPLYEADQRVWDLEAEHNIDAAGFRSKGRATPFHGWAAEGRIVEGNVPGEEHNGKAH